MFSTSIETGPHKICRVWFTNEVDLNTGNLEVLQTCHFIDFTRASWEPCKMHKRVFKIRQRVHHPMLKIILDHCREQLSKDQGVTLSAKVSEA